ncbi:tropomyosin-1-like [Gossypium arboreum]|uniref:tropomyosin-1-like n=1 Tax=Gossypium arboreum TaxID=29729 RepID=UPI0008194A44|nr:tropomyosin-1-like [Gossypium arboreum]
MHLRLDADVQRSEAEKWRRGKAKAEKDLDSLKTDYKKLRLSMRTAGLGKTFEQWHHKIREKKTKADRWERKFREAQARNEDLEKSLSESRNERGELKARVAELEKSLHQYRNCNTTMELRASLNKIEEMGGKIEELETSLQNCEMRIQFFEANEDRWKEQLYHAQDQVRNRDYIIGEAITQIREVVDYLQALAVQADILGVKYELESDRGQELASLFKKIKAMSIRAKSYL